MLVNVNEELLFVVRILLAKHKGVKELISHSQEARGRVAALFSNRDLCSQVKVKQDVSSECYVINLYVSGRSLINTKNHREGLLENRIPDLERVYGIIFKIKREV